MFRPLIALTIAAAALAIAASARVDIARAPRVMPAALDEPGEPDDDGFSRRRRAWIESLHRHAPGFDWRAQDTRYRVARHARQQDERRALLAAGATPEELREVRLATVTGQWSERGSNDVAGRVLATTYVAANDELIVLSDGGNVWRASRATLNWTSPNDAIRFGPDFGFNFLERLAGASGERLLVNSNNPIGFYRSDDGGVTWQAATGLTTANPFYAVGLTARDAAATDVYFLRLHYDFDTTSYRPYLSRSTNRGQSFTGLGYVGDSERTSMDSPLDSTEVYILAENRLLRIDPMTQVPVFVSNVPLGRTLANGDRVILRTGVSAGQNFLYAFFSIAALGRTEVLRSLDGGQTWTFRTAVPTTMFSPTSADVAPRDPNRAYAGGVNAYRTADGGSTWTKINDWTEYYAAPAIKLHADLPQIEVWLDAANAERVMFSTDGGVYESTDNGLTVRNLSLSGLRDAQYYGSYTVRSPPYAMLVGSQDQGYQKALVPTGGIESFVQVISGDYAYLTSANDGASLWLVYPGSANFDTNTAAPGLGSFRNWNFDQNGFRDYLFLAPMAADPTNPNRVSIAGGNFNSSGHRVLKLSWNGVSFAAFQDSFNFVEPVTAIAYSPQTPTTRYAVNDAGSFFRDTGAGWTMTASGLPDGKFFYGNAIAIDPAVAGRIYVGGAGYSNPAVYVSTNDGMSFQPMSTGLPSTLVYGLAISPDGEMLFAATEVGAFYYDRTLAQWQDISGVIAPDQVYWHVDYVPQLRVARFSTYGRGIWDFALADPNTLFRDGFE